MVDVADLYLRADSSGVDRATRSLDGMERSARRTEGATERMNRENQRAVDSLQNMRRMAIAAGAALAAIGVTREIRRTIATFAEYERSMAQVAAITRASAAEMEQMNELAKQLGSTTEFTAAQAASGFRYLGQAGFSAAQSIQALPDVLNLATAASLDLGRAADIASNIMSGFGIAADEASRATDVLAAISSRANTDVQQLGDAMAMVGPVAAGLGIDIGDAAAAIGILSDAGIQGSSAGAGLRRVLSSLSNPTAEAERRLMAMGLTLDDVNPQTNDLADVIGRLGGAGLSTADALQIFGDRGGPAIMALTGNIPRLRELTNTMQDVEGESRRMADVMRDTLSGDFLALQSAVDGVRIALGERLGESLRETTQNMTELVGSIQELVTSDEFEVWAGRATTAVQALAAVIGARLVVALGSAAAAKIYATQQAIAYQLALARMAGVSATAVVATGTLASSLSLVGGPVGAAILAGAGIYQFSRAVRESNKPNEDLRDLLGDVSEEMQTFESRIKDVTRYVKSLAGETKALNEQLVSSNEAVTDNAGLQRMLNNLFGEGARQRARHNQITGQGNDLAEIFNELSGGSIEVAEQLDVDTRSLAEAKGEAAAATNELTEAMEAALEVMKEQSRATRDVIADLQEQIRMLGMSSREQAIYTNLKKAGANASLQEQIAIIALTGALYDEEQARRAAARAAEEQEAAALAAALSAQRAADATQATYRNMVEGIQRDWADTIFEMITETELRFDSMWDAVTTGYLRMISQVMSRNLTDMLTGQRPMSATGMLDGIGGLNANILSGLTGSGLARLPGMERALANAGLPNAAVAGGDYTVSGEMATQFNPVTFAQNIGAGIAGGFVGDKLGEAIFGKEAQSRWGAAAGGVIGTAIGGPLGSFIGSGLGSMLDVAFGGDGKQRMNAGMFVAGTHDLSDPRVFAVDRFESGFAPTGYARRADQDAAHQVIGVFRDADSEFAKAVRDLGGTLDLTVATLAGLDEEATPGSRGTFLGLGGLSELTGDIEQQLNGFVAALVEHTGGLEPALMDAMKSARSAAEVMAILNDAVHRNSEVSTDAASAATAAANQMTAAERRLMTERTESVREMLGVIDDISAMQQSIQMQQAELMGASPLFDIEYTAREQFRHLEELRRQLVQNHQQEVRAEQRLHEQRMRAAMGLTDAMIALQLGPQSHRSAQDQFLLAQQEFRNTLAMAQGGDVEAAQRLQSIAQTYAEQSQNMFASSAEHKGVMEEILAGLEHTADVIRPDGEFDASELNQRLVDELRQIDAQLAEIRAGVGAQIVDQLSQINVNLSDLSDTMRNQVIGAIGDFVQSGASGQEMLDALGGIRGSIDVLPPEIGDIMVGAMTVLIREIQRTGGSGQRTTESMPSGSLPQSAAEQALIDMGFNLNFAADEIANHVAALEAQMGHTHDFVRQVYSEAVAAGIGSIQLADVLGYSQAEIYQALRDSGIDPTGFRDGGIARGPDSGHLQLLHGTEAVVPLPDGRSIPVQINDQSSKAVVVELQALRAEVSELRRLTMTKGEVDNDNDRRAIAALESMDSKLEADRGVGSRRYGHAS